MWQGFVLGLILGGNLGFLLASVCWMSKHDDAEFAEVPTAEDRALRRGLYLVPPKH